MKLSFGHGDAQGTEAKPTAGLKTPLLGIKEGRGLPRWLSSKESACQCRRRGFDPWIGKIPWRRKWQPAPVFSPGKSLGQRSLAGYSACGHKEANTI